MNLRKIVLACAVPATFFLSSAAFSTEFINCNLNGFGLEKGAQLNMPYGHNLFRTRHGNKGKGNGGEAYDAYATFDGQLHIDTIVCLDTATDDEDTGGTLFIDFLNGLGYVPVGSVGPELDPGFR